MSLFFAMLAKLFPLYATMGAGTLLARAFGNFSATLAQIQIYFIVPVIIMTSMMKLDMSASVFLMPVALALICMTMGATTYFTARAAGYKYAPLLAQASGAANFGYLGMPIALIVLPADFLPVYVLTMAGGIIYESSLGYYWVARGRYSPRDAIRSLMRMPLIYAIAVGLFLNAMGVSVPAMWAGVERDFLGAYVVLGALIIGVGLIQQGKIKFNVTLFGLMYVLKFAVWPFLTIGLIAVLRLTPFALPQMYEPILLLMSVLPLAANTAALAALLDVYPDEAATAVALSTLLSLVIVPLYVTFFGFAHV